MKSETWFESNQAARGNTIGSYVYVYRSSDRVRGVVEMGSLQAHLWGGCAINVYVQEQWLSQVCVVEKGSLQAWVPTTVTGNMITRQKKEAHKQRVTMEPVLNHKSAF